MVAGELDLSPDDFWREIKRGIVHSVVERGGGEDAGRVRLTFRYRAPFMVGDVERLGSMINRSGDDPAAELSSPARTMRNVDDF